MPPALGDFDGRRTMPRRDRWRHRYPRIQPDLGLLSIYRAGDASAHVAGPARRVLLRPDLPADFTEGICSGLNTDVNGSRAKQGKQRVH